MISLTPEQETLMIPLYARAQLTRQGSPLLTDKKAVEIVEALDYDFTRFDGDPLMLLGSVLRTRIHDHWLEAWLADHPTGTVVEIGAGLNTRFERVDNGRLHWVDLDLPDAMGLRRQFFTETSRRRMIGASVTDAGWLDALADLPTPMFFVAEAVLIYLPEPDVHSVFARLAQRQPGATMSFDSWTSWIRDHTGELGAVTNLGAQVRWTCDDPQDLERSVPSMRVVDSRRLFEAPDELVALLPEDFRQLMPQMRNVPRAVAYRQNLAWLGAS